MSTAGPKRSRPQITPTRKRSPMAKRKPMAREADFDMRFELRRPGTVAEMAHVLVCALDAQSERVGAAEAVSAALERYVLDPLVAQKTRIEKLRTRGQS